MYDITARLSVAHPELTISSTFPPTSLRASKTILAWAGSTTHSCFPVSSTAHTISSTMTPGHDFRQSGRPIWSIWRTKLAGKRTFGLH